MASFMAVFAATQSIIKAYIDRKTVSTSVKEMSQMCLPKPERVAMYSATLDETVRICTFKGQTRHYRKTGV